MAGWILVFIDFSSRPRRIRFKSGARLVFLWSKALRCSKMIQGLPMRIISRVIFSVLIVGSILVLLFTLIQIHQEKGRAINEATAHLYQSRAEHGFRILNRE